MIYLRDDGSRYLRLEGFETSNGPDVHVWITDQKSGGDCGGCVGSWPNYDDGDYIKLGELKGNIGDQNYEIPDDADLAGDEVGRHLVRHVQRRVRHGRDRGLTRRVIRPAHARTPAVDSVPTEAAGQRAGRPGDGRGDSGGVGLTGRERDRYAGHGVLIVVDDGGGDAGQAGRHLAVLPRVAAAPGVGQHRPERGRGLRADPCAVDEGGAIGVQGADLRGRQVGEDRATVAVRWAGRRTPTSVTSDGLPGARSSST